MTRERILVIGSAPDTLRSLVTEVQDPHGYQAVTGTNRDDGLRLALSEPADLLILDLTESDPWGMDVIEALREAQRNLPIILTVAPGSEEMAVQAFRPGVKDCVVRPFEVDDMLATIAQAMQETHLSKKYDQRLLKLIETNQHLERRVKELSTLHAVGKSVTSYLDFEWVLKRVVEASVYITHAEEGYLLLLDQDSGELYMRAGQNMGESHASEFRLRVDDSIAGEVVRTGEPIILSALSAEQTFKVKTNLLVRSLLNVPLKVKDRIIGVLGVDNHSHSEPFTKNDLRLLTALAEYAVVAIENASLYKRTNMELESRVHELSVIHGIAQELSASLDLERIMDLVVARLMDLVPAAAALMMLALNGQQRWRTAGYLQQAL
ncbi:MAG: GAF domain-containing protein, partial [Anaerolineae bacterium]